MPALSQNLTKFEADSFSIEFIVIDAAQTIGFSNYCGWWGLGNASSALSSTTTLIQGNTIGGGSSYNVTINEAGCSASATQLNASSSPGCTIGIGDTTVTVNIGYSQFENISPGDYYHELILMDRETNVCYQCRSQVVASGILTVNDSLFTNYVYR